MSTPALRIILIYGGQSGEHEVSCRSAVFVEESLQQAGYETIPVYVSPEGGWHRQAKVSAQVSEQLEGACFIAPLPSSEKEVASLLHIEKAPETANARYALISQRGLEPFDFVFPIIHGTTGEDGRLQGLLDFYKIPYAGTGVLGSALAMDKFYARGLFKQASLPQTEWIMVEKKEWNTEKEPILKDVTEKLTYPVFTKPCNLGSSVGVKKAESPEELPEAIEESFLYDHKILIETGIDAREVEIAITGNWPNYQLSEIGEIAVKSQFYSYEAKYAGNDDADLIVPAQINEAQKKEVRELAQKAFSLLARDGFARVDFFLDRKSGRIYLNEINTLPGFTSISMFPILWKAAGVDGPSLLKRLVELGLKRNEHENSLRHIR